MKTFQLSAVTLILSASVVFAATGIYTVQWKGSLRAVHGGDVSAKVALQPFAGKPNLYAVGPVAGLDGEITAIAGKFYIARVKGGEIRTDSDLSTSASFLVWSEVAAWRPSVPLAAKTDNHAQLEKQIELLASNAGIDTSKPFPFKLDGVLDSVEYHVLVAKAESQRQDHSGHGHGDGAKKISSKNSAAQVIGFFSKNHQGEFTHRGSFAHLHIVERNGVSGHVDEIVAGAAVRVSFPQ